VGKKTTEDSNVVNDHIALERHEFFMKAMKALFTMAVAIVLIFTAMVVYSSFVKNEFPTASDVVDLIKAMSVALVKVL
jgi:cbb3-type cytochrome oxidase subunit 3